MKHHYDTVDSDELPIVLEDGGPTAGSKHVEIIHGECGNCDYDRLKVKRQCGEVVETCMLCEYSRFGSGPWEAPTTDRNRLNDIREYADNDGSPVEKIGEVGVECYGRGPEVFDVPAGIEVHDYFGSNSVKRCLFHANDLKGIVALLENERGFVTDVVDQYVDGRAVTHELNTPNNPNAIHVGIWEHRHGDRETSVRLANAVRHDDAFESLPPIHLDHEADGIVP